MQFSGSKRHLAVKTGISHFPTIEKEFMTSEELKIDGTRHLMPKTT
jgi:hypothetical protein